MLKSNFFCRNCELRSNEAIQKYIVNQGKSGLVAKEVPCNDQNARFQQFQNNKKFIENLALLIQMRLALNLTDPIDLDELNEDLIQKRLAELEKNENWLRSIVKIGVHEYPSKQPLPTKPDELNSTLETRGVMVRKGLWGQMKKDGSPYFIIIEHNQENFKKAPNRLSLQIVA